MRPRREDRRREVVVAGVRSTAAPPRTPHRDREDREDEGKGERHPVDQEVEHQEADRAVQQVHGVTRARPEVDDPPRLETQSPAPASPRKDRVRVEDRDSVGVVGGDERRIDVPKSVHELEVRRGRQEHEAALTDRLAPSQIRDLAEDQQRDVADDDREEEPAPGKATARPDDQQRDHQSRHHRHQRVAPQQR